MIALKYGKKIFPPPLFTNIRCLSELTMLSITDSVFLFFSELQRIGRLFHVTHYHLTFPKKSTLIVLPPVFSTMLLTYRKILEENRQTSSRWVWKILIQFDNFRKFYSWAPAVYYFIRSSQHLYIRELSHFLELTEMTLSHLKMEQHIIVVGRRETGGEMVERGE